MPKKKAIPDEVREQVEDIVQQFNQVELNSQSANQSTHNIALNNLLEKLGGSQEKSGQQVYYSARFRGRHLYLDRYAYGRSGPICRLTYKGEMDNWDFAIFKYSKEHYDPGEWFFPGSQYVDGTIEGAMRAGMEAYPT